MVWKPPTIAISHSSRSGGTSWRHPKRSLGRPGTSLARTACTLQQAASPMLLMSRKQITLIAEKLPILKKSRIFAKFGLLSPSSLLVQPPCLWLGCGIVGQKGSRQLSWRESCLHVEVETTSRCSQKASKAVQKLLTNICQNKKLQGQWTWRKKSKFNFFQLNRLKKEQKMWAMSKQMIFWDFWHGTTSVFWNYLAFKKTVNQKK